MTQKPVIFVERNFIPPQEPQPNRNWESTEKTVKRSSPPRSISVGVAMNNLPISRSVKGMKEKAVFKPNVRFVVKNLKIINQKDIINVPDFMRNGDCGIAIK